MQKTIDLTVDTGALMVNLRDNTGEVIGQFRFNPTDLDILQRANVFIEKMNSIAVPSAEDYEALQEVTSQVKELFDYLLNYKVSDQIFAKCNPFSPNTEGDFYCEVVMDGIAKIIEDTMGKRIEKKRVKIQKAVAKYHK